MHWTHFCLKMFQRQGGGMSWMGSWLKTMEIEVMIAVKTCTAASQVYVVERCCGTNLP
jgi:hypothetical protein